MKTLDELRSRDPVWPRLHAELQRAEHPVRILPVDVAAAETTLLRLQVTTRSVLGSLALHTGGLLVDHGWLRVLGGGGGALDLALANGLDRPRPAPPGHLLVAHDPVGGRYAVNGGDLPGEPGEVCYFAPDELAWLPMEMGHGAFVAWSLTDRLGLYNEHLRWPRWEEEVEALAPDEGFHLYPPPFTREGQDVSAAARDLVPIVELLGLYDTYLEQVDPGPDGTEVSIRSLEE